MLCNISVKISIRDVNIECKSYKEAASIQNRIQEKHEEFREKKKKQK